PAAELQELANIYIGRGVEPALASEIARQMTAHDALGAHARDELGINDAISARPIQAALTSAATFAAGAAAPLLVALVAPLSAVGWWVAGGAIIGLGVLGALGALAGGAPIGRSVARVVFWGALAMAVTAAVGRLFDVAV